MIRFIDGSLTQYRANLHCHSTLSDGRLTPEELKRIYRDHGYSILSITDHEVPAGHADMSEPDFLMLTGYECYIRKNPNGRYDPYEPEVHLNLFARDPRNEKMVCYHPSYVKYLNKIRSPEETDRVGSEEMRVYSPGYVNRYIATARENGYLVAYNHAYWSLESEADILAYEGCFSMEIFNGSSFVANAIEYNAGLYDRMLRAGKRIFCHATDDNHNKAPIGSPDCDSFLGCTMILAPALTYPAVIKALETGSFYASRGPRITGLSLDGRSVRVDCSPVRKIVLYTGSKSPKYVTAGEGETITSAVLPLDPRALYLRVSAFDGAGNTADSRAYFPDEYKGETES